jgi:hypothetical protein
MEDNGWSQMCQCKFCPYCVSVYVCEKSTYTDMHTYTTTITGMGCLAAGCHRNLLRKTVVVAIMSWR